MSDKRTKFKSETAAMVTYDFVCEGCGSEGELGLLKKDGMKPFGCPEECGAIYVSWRPTPKGEWQLRCVVKPYFEEAKP